MSGSTQRICSRCEQNQTPLGRVLFEVRNSRGHSVGLFCEDCRPVALDAVERDAVRCGAHVVHGVYLSSPRGTSSRLVLGDSFA